MIKIAPSVLSADFSDLKTEISTLNGADWLHVDVMDGHFVPNISIGVPVVRSLRRATELTLDVHLMIEKPVRFVRQFIEAGADIVNIHLESDQPQNLEEAITLIKSMGRRAGMTIKPKTPAKLILPWLSALDLVLVMMVEPGFGGQGFMAEMLPKIGEIGRYIDENGLSCELQVDGGINPDTAKLCADAGATVLVAGSDIFSAPDRAARIRELKGVRI